MASQTCLQVGWASFSFTGTDPLLNQIEIHLRAGQRVAITGPNGSGKSTLLKLLIGELDGAENYRLRTRSGTTRLISQDVNQRHPQLSGGESRRLEVGAAFASEAQVLLFDEPTNDLDPEAKREFLAHLDAATKRALVLVSHDPDVLDRVDEIWELRQGLLFRHPPGFTAYAERLEAEEARLHAQLAHLEHASRAAKARARDLIEKQQKRMERGKRQGEQAGLPKIVRGARKRQAEQTLARVATVQSEGMLARDEQIRAAKSRLRQLSRFDWDPTLTAPPHGRRMVQLRGVRLAGFARDLDFDLFGAQRIHLRGKNGSGKSTLLRALIDEPDALERVTGELYAASPRQLFDQRLSQFQDPRPLWQWFTERASRGTNANEALARTLLGRLGFAQTDQQRPVRSLSGGEKMRIELALALHQAEPPQLLLLDEPTNHLDLESRRILSAFVERFAGALIVVSHDERFARDLRLDGLLDLDAYR